MPTASHQATPIWDLPTRIFHWLLVLLVGTNLFLIGPRGGIETVIHFVAGFAIAGLLLFRLLSAARAPASSISCGPGRR